MATHLDKAHESSFLPPDSVDLKQTLDDLIDSSPAIQSKMNGDDSSNSDFLSACLDDQSDSALFLDVGTEEEDNASNSSPVKTVSVFSPLKEENETKPSDSVSPACSREMKPAIVGAGLANLGNTCFLNAVLQCFTHTVPLVQGLLSVDHPRPCDRDSEGCCALCALRDHIDLSLASMGRVVSPRKLVDNLSYISSSFRRFQQEDAHEFLQCLLDRLDNCFTCSNMKENALILEDENLVKQVFGGRLMSKLRCCNCGHCSDTYEPLIDLSLEIENVDTLPSALESFTKVEKIEDSDTQFTCEECKERVSVEKQLILDKAPSVAAFHLKRFKSYGSVVEKIDKNVEFPLELDLLPYASCSQNNNVELRYDLYAVVVHTGLSSTSGHYYCFVRSAQEVWYKLDDSKVARVREDFVLSQEAYILFYAKHGTPWFSSFMETENSFLDQNRSNNSPKSVLDNMDHICTSSSNVVNNCSCEIKKAREEVVGISAEFNGCGHYGVDVDEDKQDPQRLFMPVPLGMHSSNEANNRSCEIKKAREEVVATSVEFNGCGHDGVEVNEAKQDPQRLFTPVPIGMRNSSNGTPAKVEKKLSPSALKENNCNQKSNEVRNKANTTPSTPPRSPSPDIYAEKAPAASYSIPRDHLTLEKQVSCKRQLDKDVDDDSHRKQARKLLKNMPSGRSSKLLAAMNGSHNEGKKSKRNGLPPNRHNGPPGNIHKTNLNVFMRPVAAGSLR